MKSRKALAVVGVLVVVAIVGFLSINHKVVHKAFAAPDSSFKQISTFPDIDLGNGKSLYKRLSKSNTNIVFFWASDCDHCKNFYAYLSGLRAKHKVSVPVFSICIDPSDEFLKEGSHNAFPVYLDSSMKVFRACKLEHIPTVFIVDKDGYVLSAAEGEKNCKKLIDQNIDQL